MKIPETARSAISLKRSTIVRVCDCYPASMLNRSAGPLLDSALSGSPNTTLEQETAVFEGALEKNQSAIDAMPERDRERYVEDLQPASSSARTSSGKPRIA